MRETEPTADLHGGFSLKIEPFESIMELKVKGLKMNDDYRLNEKLEDLVGVAEWSRLSSNDESKLSTKNRDKKIAITDIAIDKIPHIEYKGLSAEENDTLFKLAKLVLLTAQTENESNEVAATCTLDADDPLEVVGMSYGDEHGVDVCADVTSYHMLMSAMNCAIVVVHNHPSTQTLSIEDLRFFLHFASVRILVVVTNQGTIHYITKDKGYEYQDAKTLLKECIEGLTDKSPTKEIYMASLTFLSRCSEVGLFYH